MDGLLYASGSALLQQEEKRMIDRPNTTSSDVAEEFIRAGLRARELMDREAGTSIIRQANDRGELISRATLKHELGDFGDWDGESYTLDTLTRDRLIAHARQDAALACHLASEAVKHAATAAQRSGQIRLISAATLLVSIVILVAVVTGQ